ncbi:MAG: cell division protein FtsZ, partial [Pseudomonadota bacterium]
PLLDESSMRGAGGLLISITGGRDLTLFEVDEAATRIREEVDQEANIILGATFDEDLEGVIRVSVVATGIDSTLKAAKLPPEVRRTEAISRNAPVATPAKPAEATVAQPAQVPSMASMESKVAKTAASLELPREAEKVERDGVTIEPFKPAASAFSDPDMEAEFKEALESELMQSGESFVPPVAEEPAEVVKTASIPEVGEMQPVARPQPEPMRQPEVQPQGQHGSTGQGPMGLLNKLKSSFGVREEPMIEEASKPAPSPSMAPRPAAPAPELSAPVKLQDDPYAPKRASLDSTGRTMPAERGTAEHDQLDIPAFLRRQAN